MNAQVTEAAGLARSGRGRPAPAEGTAIAAQEGPDSLAVAAYLSDGRGGQVESSVELIEDRSRS